MATKTNFSIVGQPGYPQIKLTREAFPRALATRIIKSDGDEYFGPFLNRTSVRLLIDFLNRTFRLRSCDIDINGSFPVPCTQYYAKRCLGPCVANLCDRATYLDVVDLERLFLRNDRELFEAAIGKKIEAAAEALDFETAAFFRDVRENVRSFLSKPRWQVWLDDSVDTFELVEHYELVYIILVSLRGRRMLGELVFAFSRSPNVPASSMLRAVIEQFYVHHLPRAIRVSEDFDGRQTVAKALGVKHGRPIKIEVVSASRPRITAIKAVEKAKARISLEEAAGKRTPIEIRRDLKQIFGLGNPPLRIEAFDVAHISATGFAAAVSVWDDGNYLPDEYQHWISNRESELESLAEFVATRLADKRYEIPQLILVDGGPAHLKAAMKGKTLSAARGTMIIAAVKPRGKHYSISHFLTEDGRRISYDQKKPALRVLHRLRDDAHDLANATHRLGRDMMHFYELAAILPSLEERERQELMREFGSIRSITSLESTDFEKRFGKEKSARAINDLSEFSEGRSRPQVPLIVPIRFVETDGAAEDLIPIDSR